MTKKQKQEYIDKVNDRFTNARNHGHQGNNWWYPVPNRIAYNVKLYDAGASIKDIRDKITARQNDYYSDGAIYDIIAEAQARDANEYARDIEENFKGVKSTSYAGRSGGWLEVDYESTIDENSDDIEANYKAAKELDENEAAVSRHIESALAKYKKYLNSEQYIKDLIENEFMSDEIIADHYKAKIKNLTDKLK